MARKHQRKSYPTLVQMNDNIISSTDERVQPLSESVQLLANDIYKEFEGLIKLYGDGFLHKLMPLVVTALENLDNLHAENSNLHVKCVVTQDDNYLLTAEYEKEKKSRKLAETVRSFLLFIR